MKEIAERIWKYSCVPLVFYGVGILIKIIFNLAQPYDGNNNRLFLSVFTIACLLICMFLLRHIPVRCLVISSVIAFTIFLGVELLSLAVITQEDNTILRKLYDILSIFTYPLFYVAYPIINMLKNDVTVAIVGLIIEAIAPFCFIFSGKFVLIEKYFEKALKNTAHENDPGTSD